MCKIMEERVRDTEYRKAVSIAANLLKRGKDTIEEVAEITGLTTDIVKQISEELKEVLA